MGEHLVEELGREHLAEVLQAGGGGGLGFGVDLDVARRRKGDGSVAAEEDAEKAAGLAVGNAVVTVGEEGAEEDEGVVGNVVGGEGVDGEAEIAPAGDAGEGVGAVRARGQGSGEVVAAGVAAAEGEAAAFLAGGQDLGAFGAHFSPLAKCVEREAFSEGRLARDEREASERRDEIE